MSEPLFFERIALIGIGLINSSLARVIRAEGLAGHIAVCSRTHATLDKAMALGLADSMTTDVRQCVDGADLVMLGTPLGAYAALAEAMAPGLKPGCIVSDVGSAKQCVIADVGPHLPDGVHLVPGHPVAGTEHSGPEAGFAELFRGRYCILTPPPGTDEKAIETIDAMWKVCGMIVEMMPAHHHDRVLAITSHLPHLISYTIVGTATDLEEHLKSEVVRFSAGGFRDFTRIAASDPAIWRDILMSNREEILKQSQRFRHTLDAMEHVIKTGNAEALEDLIRKASESRSGWQMGAGKPNSSR